jgi:hypothetical protein
VVTDQPEDMYLDRAPYTHDEYRENVIEAQIRKLQHHGTYAPPPE